MIIFLAKNYEKIWAHVEVICDVSGPSDDTFKGGIQKMVMGSDLQSISGGGLCVWAAQVLRLRDQEDSLSCIDLSAVAMTNAPLLGAGPRLFSDLLSKRSSVTDVKLLLTDDTDEQENDGYSTTFLCKSDEIKINHLFEDRGASRRRQSLGNIETSINPEKTLFWFSLR